jgi:sugar-specific transcriptional regulator TrmB
MEGITKTLKDTLNFSDKKSAIYLTLVEFGEMSVTDLAKQAHLKRTTAYNILPELLTEGLVSKTRQRGKVFYYVDNVKDLERIIEKKQEQVSSLVQNLQNLARPFSFKPKVTLYEGVGGMKKFYQDIINTTSRGEDILTFINTENIERFIGKKTIQDYVNQRIKKKIRNLMISHPHPIAREWGISADHELREIRYTTFPYPEFSADLKIFGNKIALIAYQENCFAAVIESHELSILLKNMFFLLWERIEK